MLPEGGNPLVYLSQRVEEKKKVEEKRKWKKNIQFEMYVDLREYIKKCHSENPIDFVSNVYIFYYLSGRFPDASMRDCCTVVEALRKHYMSSLFDDDELPFS